MYENIIFDWSGVINNNVCFMHKTICAMFIHFDTNPISFDEFRSNWVQPYMDFYNKYLPNISLKEEQTFYINYINQFTPQVYPDICCLLRKLKQNNKNLFVISSDDKSTLNKQIINFGLVGIFTEIFPETYDKDVRHEELIEKYNLDKSTTVTIGDTTYEIKCGQKQGISTIGVTWGIHNEQKLLSEHPNFVANTVNELEKMLI
jgi:phosphoglycolate phosphatase